MTRTAQFEQLEPQAKLAKASDGLLLFECPGCKSAHYIRTDPQQPLSGLWTWNGSMEAPTVSPSILVRGVRPITDEQADRIMAGEKIEPIPTVCHSFVREGRIEFLGDCTHELAGHTVELPNIEE